MSAEVALLSKAVAFKLPLLTMDDDDNSSCSGRSEPGDGITGLGRVHSDSDPNQGKDSGIDCGSDTSFTPPDSETSAKILKTVEFYLSDANVLKDPFLLKHVKRNKEGYVSLKLIASFRKVRSLSRCWKAVAFSLQKSDKLALNSEGTKVRRLLPLPDHDEILSSRTVIVYGIPAEKITVETVSEIFSKCGEIALVRVLRSGSSVPPVIKQFFSKNTEAQSKTCGLVEFEDFAGAKEALALDCGKENGLRVVPLLIKEKEKPKPTPQSPTKSPLQPHSSPEQSPKKKKKTKHAKNGSRTNPKLCDREPECSAKGEHRTRRSSGGSLGYSSSCSSGYLSSSPGNKSVNDSWFLRRHSYNPALNSERPSTAFASLSNRNHSHFNNGSRDRLNKDKKDSEKNCKTPECPSPWRRRREQMLSIDPAMSSSLPSLSSVLNQRLPLPVKTIRLPRGPDDSGGFQTRFRNRLPSTAE